MLDTTLDDPVVIVTTNMFTGSCWCYGHRRVSSNTWEKHNETKIIFMKKLRPVWAQGTLALGAESYSSSLLLKKYKD